MPYWHPKVLGGSPDLCASKSSLPELEALAWLFMLMLSQREVDTYLHEDPVGQGWEPQIPRSFLGPLLLLEPRATQRVNSTSTAGWTFCQVWWQDIFNWFRKQRCKCMLGIFSFVSFVVFFLFSFWLPFLKNWKCG